MFTKDQLSNLISKDQLVGFKPVEEKKEKVIQNALKGYAKGCRREEIVAIYDTTILGNGKNGFLLATDGIYGYEFHTFKKETSDITKIPFENLQKFYCLKNSTIEEEKKNAIGDVLYRAVYSDGQSFVIYCSNTYAKHLVPIMESVLALLGTPEPKEKSKSKVLTYTVRFLGTEAVGKTSLIKALGEVAKFHEETVSSECDGRSTISWKGKNITFVETSFLELQERNLQANLWYLIVGVDEGPTEEVFDAKKYMDDVVISGVFYNKCDLVFDEEMIDLVAIETRSILEDNNHWERIREFRGASEPDGEYRQYLEEFLDDMVLRIEEGNINRMSLE